MGGEKTIVSGMLDVDVERILNNPVTTDKNRKYQLVISSPTGDIAIDLLHNLEWVRDYNGNIGEDIRAIFTMHGDVYRNYILRHRNNLEITIAKLTGDYILSSERYKFIVLSSTADEDPDAFNYFTDLQLRQFYPVKIEGQCIDRDLYSLTDIDVEGIYKESDLTKVISAEYLLANTKIDYGEGPPEIALDLVELDNKNNYGHIKVPTGTKIMNLATYLQESDSYGLYNAGVGTFLQKYQNKKYIWIYPLMDIKRYDNTLNKLMIFHSNNKRIGIDGNTFMIDGKVTKILPMYNIGYLEKGELPLQESGNAITYADPDNIFKSYRYIDNGKTLKGTKKTNVVTMSNKERKDGSNRTKYLGAINNAYKYRSKTLRDTMTIYQLEWRDCDIDIIYPGMPCIFITEDRYDGLLKLKGVVQSTAQSYLADARETHGIINIAVASPIMYRDDDSPEYEELNLKTEIMGR